MSRKNQGGFSLIEYALLLLLAAVVSAVVLSPVQKSLNSAWRTIDARLVAAVESSPALVRQEPKPALDSSASGLTQKQQVVGAAAVFGLLWFMTGKRRRR